MVRISNYIACRFDKAGCAALAVTLLLLSAVPCGAADKPLFEAELIFPLEKWHNHGSSIVELPDGSLFVCWYNGSGERTADDVKIEAARLKNNQKAWGPRFTLADTPQFPDCNPALFVDSQKRLWLVWPVILANRWETALLKLRISTKSGWASTPPAWEISDNLLFIPNRFEAKVKEVLSPWLASHTAGPLYAAVKHAYDMAGDKYFSRLGWMPRVHPIELPSGRILVPLYSDGYDFSLIAITDDRGLTWTTSEPIVCEGGVQPSIVRSPDGTLTAYMRDNGPPPQRVLITRSTDQGVTWSTAVDSDIPNPGSGLEIIGLKDGSWLLVNNDTETGRHSLSAWLSDDQGRSWKWKRHIELDQRGKGAGSFHYPSVIQTADGMIHVSYSYFLNHLAEGEPRKAIKHARFNLAWLRQGD